MAMLAAARYNPPPPRVDEVFVAQNSDRSRPSRTAQIGLKPARQRPCIRAQAIESSVKNCELQAASPTCVGPACRLGMPIERRVRGCLFRFFLRLLGPVHLLGGRRPTVTQDVPRPLQAPQESGPEIFASHCVDAF